MLPQAPAFTVNQRNLTGKILYDFFKREVVVEHNGVHLYHRTCCCNTFIDLYEWYKMGKAPTNHGPLRRNFLYFITCYFMVC